MEARDLNPKNEEGSRLIRELRYRGHSRIAYCLVLGFSASFFAGSLYTAAMIYPLLPIQSAITLLCGILLPGATIYQLYQFFTPVVFANIKVFNDSVFIENKNSVSRLYFKDIESYQFSMITYVGGWFEFRTSQGESFRFSTVLERCEYILQAIEKYDSQLVDQEEIQRFVKISLQCDHIWARLYDRSREKIALAFKYIAFPQISLGLYFLLSQNLSDIIGLFLRSPNMFLVLAPHWVLGILSFFLKEGIHNLRFEKRYNQNDGKTKIRDTRFEAKCIHFANLAYYSLSLITAGFLAFMN